MCEKQCRDENGFKQHGTSEAHLRQMALFAANPERFMDQFSAEFEKGFIELLARRFGADDRDDSKAVLLCLRARLRALPRDDQVAAGLGEGEEA